MDSSEIHLDFDSNFEPQFRARSNTWPQRPSRELEPHNSPVAGDESSNGGDQTGSVKDPLGLTAKKSGSRRNAWGNLSYADLITKAIQSSPEKRLTLSQIYDWMVQNVPYFKDKGDSTSSAGWKNSIRHNLSLHSRFMRIQNEGTGKSSWWVLNPDAKPGKTPRRRAGSMETKSYEKKRGRIRKKVEALRASMENGGTLSPGDCDDYLDGLNFGDFRPRAGSSTSNCSRLSPISAVAEPDLSANDIQPMSSIPWGSQVCRSPTLYTDTVYSDLVESLVEGMKLSSQDNMKMDMVNDLNGPYISDNSSDFSQPSSYNAVNQSSPGLETQYTQLTAPPPYPKQQPKLNGLDFQQQNFNNTQNFNNALRLQIRSSPVNNGPAAFSPSELYNNDFSDSVLDIKQETLSPVRMGTPSSLSANTQQLACPEQGSPNSGSFTHHSPQSHSGLQPQAVLTNGMSQHACQVSPQQNRHQIHQQPITTASLQQQALHQATCDSILREALTRGALTYRQNTVTTSSSTYSLGNHTTVAASSSMVNGLNMGSNPNLHHHSATSGQLRGIGENCIDNHTISVNCTGNGSYGNLGVPLDIDMDLMGISSLDYDMDQVIKQELTLEGNLDFIFDAGPTTSVGQNVVH